MKIALPTALILFVLDQLLKLWALGRLQPGVPVPILGDVFDLTLTFNPGVAFGFLGTLEPAWRWLVGVLSLVALTVLGSLAVRLLPDGHWWTASALGLIFGGALGNLLDRVRFGAVVDFLDFHWRDYHWPAFNLADSGITVGVGILVVHFLVLRRQKP
jgi:signal peptidase II